MKTLTAYLITLMMTIFSIPSQAESTLKNPIESCKSNIEPSSEQHREILVPKDQFELFKACILKVQSLNFMHSNGVSCEKIIPAYEEILAKSSKVNFFISDYDRNKIFKSYDLQEVESIGTEIDNYYMGCKGDTYDSKNELPDKGDVYDIQVVHNRDNYPTYVDKISGLSYAAAP
ncbi:hypothetical protein ACYZT8_27655 [Pseudomonas sp. LB3P93]